jgi:ribosomal protein S18 acetylase RimI-like enzyme
MQCEEEDAMKVRLAGSDDHDQLVILVADFRVTMSGAHGRPSQDDLKQAEVEIESYHDPRYHVFVAEEPDDNLIGYMVCRVEDRTVFAESMFVPPTQRRQGVASALYDEAERLVQEVGSDTVYNWVHPNNDRIISFLRNRNYTVLNLIEIRRRRPDETPTQRIKVGKQSFDH